MNVGSLFSGIGGIDLGLERAGMRVSWCCESDPYARAVLGLRFPGAVVYPDVRALRADQLDPVDLLCGGFPCQDISVAGRGAGLGGERSGLWYEFARLIRDLRPRYVLVENVPALRSRGLGVVLGHLAACGYDAEWDCLPAVAFGAPHRRDRLFVVAYAAGQSQREPSDEADSVADVWQARPQLVHGGQAVADAARHGRNARRPSDAEEEQGGREPRGGGVGAALAHADGEGQLQPQGAVREQRGRVGDGGEPVADPNGARLAQRQGVLGNDGAERPAVVRDGWWSAEPDVGRVADGVPARVDRLRCIGNAVVPQIAEWIGRRILAHAAAEGVTR